MERTQRLLRELPKSARIIEVGPSFAPLAPKRDGWDTFVIDHASQAELLIKYADQDAARIEPVDAIWTGGALSDAIPVDRHGTFDAFIASHVIEHTPDVVAFLRAAEILLRPDGIVILAVPDKRKCFDVYRYPSATADAISAHLERRDRHTVRTHIDYTISTALKDGVDVGWSGRDMRPTALVNTLASEPQARHAAAQPYYTDAHAWMFVPSSFELMIEELSALGYLDLRVEEIVEAPAGEFYAWLRRGREALGPEAVQARRQRLMDRIVVELAEQSWQVPDSPLRGLPSPSLVRDQIAEASRGVEELCIAAMRIVLDAERACLGWGGLDRARFRRLIGEASRTIQNEGPAAVQHRVLMEGSARVLGITGAIDDTRTSKP